jgi:ribonuclease HI
MEITQINLQHCKEATATLGRLQNGLHTFISLIQEPYLAKGKIRGLHQKDSVILAAGPRPRACITASKNAGCTMITELCSNDLVAALVKAGPKGKRAVIASAYLPFDSPNPPPTRELINLVDWCNARSLPLLVGMDANAHHVNWGSTNCNPRGIALLEYIAGENLVIANRGNAPTFVTRARQEVLDITVTSQELSSTVRNWRVSDEPSLSDHRHIRFSLDAKQTRAKPFRNPRKTDWTRYRSCLEQSLGQGQVAINSTTDIERELGKINRGVIRAYQEACPLQYPRRRQPTPWWSMELATLKRNCRRAEREARNDPTPEKHLMAKNARKEYKYAIRHAKTADWRRQCKDIKKIPEAARLRKLLSSDDMHTIGLLKKADGSMTEDGKGTLNRLLEVHFPGSKMGRDEEAYLELKQQTMIPSPQQRDWARVLADSIIDNKKLTWAVGSLNSYKAPGTDKIIPVMLQEGLPILGETLCSIFKGCLTWAYLPKPWRRVRVVFIPKPGKKDYSEPKAFRPISLSSFLLKTMEKLIDRYVRARIVVSAPLNSKQHAYQTGKSTETALHALVSRAERAIDRGQFAVGAFFDIQGAFDNAPFEAMNRALINRNIETPVVNWIIGMLKMRIVETQLQDSTASALVARGCPQGGVLSPLLWTLVADELLRTLDSRGIYCQAYADDGTILVEGSDLQIVCDLVQSGLREVLAWCENNGLSINPSKTELIMFTRKRKIPKIKAPRLNNVELNFRKKVKYLGVVLDEKLTFKEHLEEKCDKANVIIWQCRSAIGRKWGLRPAIIRWIYMAVIKPMITYGAVVWWEGTGTANAKDRLGRVQRLACLCITGAMSTTPTAALEVLTNLIPLDIQVVAEAMKTFHRLCRLGLWWNKGKIVGHRLIAGKTKGIHPMLSMGTDHCLTSFNSGGFNLTEHDQDDRKTGTYPALELECFTDGSRNPATGLSGAGVYIRDLDTEESIPLGAHASAFQSEVFAILRCAQLLTVVAQDDRTRPVIIKSDNLGALRAISSPIVRSKLVKECQDALSELATRTATSLQWVPGHSGIHGNEVANQLAKSATKAKPIGAEPSLGLPQSTIKRIFEEWAAEQHRIRWCSSSIARATKELVPIEDHLFKKKLLSMSKNKVQTAVRLITGHCGSKYHMWQLRLIPEPDCPCGYARQTAIHLLCECDLYKEERQLALGAACIRAPDVHNLHPRRIHSFVRLTGLML